VKQGVALLKAVLLLTLHLTLSLSFQRMPKWRCHQDVADEHDIRTEPEMDDLWLS